MDHVQLRFRLRRSELYDSEPGQQLPVHDRSEPPVSKLRLLIQGVLCLLTASELAAAEARVEFIARANGQRVSGAEVCFSRAGYGPSPIEKFAASEDFRCLPADQVIAMTPGRWLFTIRHRERKLIAAGPATLNVPAPGPPVDVFHQFAADLTEAGLLDLSSADAALRPDERLALYISNDNVSQLPVILPIPRGERAVLAPAGTTLQLLLMQHSRVLNVGEPFSVASGVSAAVPPFRRTAADDCGAVKTEASKPDPVAARLFACEGLQPAQSPNTVDRRRCKAIAEPASLDARERRAVFHGVKSGSYLVSVHEPGFPTKFAIATLTTGKETKSLVTFDSFNVLGRVTLDGEPLKARLDFATGTVVSGADGFYVGSLKGKPWKRQVKAIRCSDGEYVGTHVAATPIEAGVPQNIDLRSNHLRISVVDSETGQPIAKSFVDVSAREADGSNPLTETLTTTDGNATLRYVPTNAALIVCAGADHYQHTCNEPFLFGDEHERSVQVRLQPKPYSGRLRTDHQLPWGGLVLFVRPDGSVSEESTLRADGTFDFRAPHVTPEYIVVSADVPLFVQPLGETPADTMDIVPSALPPRTIEISIAPESAKADALIALFLDGRYIPQRALQLHQGMRGMQFMLIGRGPLRVPDLAAREIRVGLGPSVADFPPKTLVPDWFLRPEYASRMIAKGVDASNRVVF